MLVFASVAILAVLFLLDWLARTRKLNPFNPIEITSQSTLALPPGFSFGEGAGKVTILPGFGKTPLVVPSNVERLPGVIPLLQIDLENPKRK